MMSWMADIKKEQGEYREAAELMTKSKAMKDSIEQSKNTEKDAEPAKRNRQGGSRAAGRHEAEDGGCGGNGGSGGTRAAAGGSPKKVNRSKNGSARLSG